MDLYPPSEIERLYGTQALEEWRLVLRQFELGEGFAFIVLTVPDKTAAQLCRNDLQAFLATRDRTLTRVAPTNPEELALLATTLLTIPNDQAIGAVWVESLSDQHSADYPNWEAAWSRALGSLNQQRNLLRRRSASLLLVGAPWIAPMVRQRAPDLWSVRALVARIDPIILDRGMGENRIDGAIRSRGDDAHRYSHEPGPSPDVGLGQQAAERLRGRAGSARTLGDVLTRTARGLDASGDWEGATAAWQEAVTAYSLALEEDTRDRVPLDWATTQNNLGNALQTLGERESGTARLEEAVAAYRAALMELTRDRVPLDWATTQNNLGNALATLGERENNTARLDEAVTAYRAALEERTRDRVPLDWAATQNNLGTAFQTLGARESGTTRLDGAVAAYRAALEERTRDRVPLDWAMTQNNLGNALQRLGERESGTARLEQAVTAYRAALEERTRNRVPLDWAMTQNNLGSALLTLGQRESGIARLEQAVTAYRAALVERTRDRVPMDWAQSHYNLAEALATLAERKGDRARMAEAIGCMRNAAEVYREGGNSYWLPIAEERVAAMEAMLAAMAP